MMERVYVRPADGLSVPDMEEGVRARFPAEGKWSLLSMYVRRRIADGSLIIDESMGGEDDWPEPHPSIAPTAPVQEMAAAPVASTEQPAADVPTAAAAPVVSQPSTAPMPAGVAPVQADPAPAAASGDAPRRPLFRRGRDAE